MKTTVILNKSDFSQFEVEENLHVVISVKDFKTIVTHAETMDATLRACYSRPGRPLQFSYEKPGLICKFTLMTAGEARANVPTGPTKAANAKKPASKSGVSTTTTTTTQPPPSQSMPPPQPRTEGRRSTQTLGRRADNNPPAQPVVRKESESLFVSQEEDRDWDPTNYDDNEEMMLGWDTREREVRCRTPGKSIY